MSSQSKASYGGRDQNTRGVSGKFLVIGIVGVLLVAGVFIWSQWRNSSDADVSATVAGFSDNTGDSIMMNLDITRDDSSRPAYCIVTAMNYDKAEVGRREAVVAAGGDATTRLRIKVPTREQAVATDVYGCSTIFPSYLDDSTTTED
ncbi:DUF4307 domain-containing protein [uncultured Corynebacterium sp.]|uniref:DUF4307 domain-containing protein n=1 Tax=uncultured Corynebacterium sp. TaxID=159447 RepID=UPI0025F1FE0D|nr:DUF4307 domain-containing protein [uncultured Corynebacterium sp.]